MYKRLPNVNDVVTEIKKLATQEEKVASATSEEVPTSALGSELYKLAQLLKKAASDPEVTYSEVIAFGKQLMDKS